MPPDPFPDAVVVYRSRSRRACAEHGLMLESMGIEYGLHEEEGQLQLLVRPGDVAQARRHLAEYDQQRRSWPPTVERFEVLSRGRAAASAYVAVLVAVFALEHLHGYRAPWIEAGLADAGRIRAGEWWRTLTALSLHADVAHLFGNLFFGALFGCLGAQMLGSGLAWCAAVAAGALGNALNALLHPAGHTSLGASTAVFGALGLIVAYPWMRRRELPVGRLRRWAPPALGLVLLGYLGTSGERTDVLAHVLGFAVGGLLGAALGRAHRGRLAGETPSRGLQLLLGLLPLAALAAAWYRALAP